MSDGNDKAWYVKLAEIAISREIIISLASLAGCFFIIFQVFVRNHELQFAQVEVMAQQKEATANLSTAIQALVDNTSIQSEKNRVAVERLSVAIDKIIKASLEESKRDRIALEKLIDIIERQNRTAIPDEEINVGETESG